jgi:hypothetical protein
MRRSLLVVLLAALLPILPALADDLPIRPDDTITPGKAWSTDPAEVCGKQAEPNETCEPGHDCGVTGSYSKRHRHTTAEEKRDTYAAYHVEKGGRDFEVDHRVPLCLGGADLPENLWPQEGFEHPSYHDKDRLEEHICLLVCRDHSMSLQDGQAIFLGDWVAEYQKMFGEPPK